MHVFPRIVVPPELEAQYHRALENLQHNALSHGLNRELLRSRARVYSVRLNKKGRLLIAPYQDEQARVSWVVLDCLPDHKYESIYLRMSQRELEQRILAIRHPTQNTPVPVDEVGEGEEILLAPMQLEFYQNRLIQLTVEQEEVASARLPLVVNGVAGSGKTCVGESLLNQAAVEASREVPAVFVATSSRLVQKTKASYINTYGDSDHVLFLTYQQVLERVLGQVEFVNDDHLIAWLNSYMRAKRYVAHVSLSPERVSREFRQVCIFKSGECDRYLELGARHSSLNDEEKKWVFTAYQAYHEDLIAHQQVHLDLFHEGVRVSFSFMVADESQDLSPAALNTLRGMVGVNEGGQPRIVYLADANQSLQNGNLLVLHHLIRLVGDDNIKTLSVSHRSPLAVIESANLVLTLRNSILGGVYDKYTQSTLAKAETDNQNRGEMVWTDKVQESRYHERWSRMSQTTDFAVVTQESYVFEARRKFNTPLVFTPTQIKGLEYKEVVAYRLIEGEHVKTINEKLKKGEIKQCVNRARRDALSQDNIPLAVYLNELFTTFTRALDSLFVYQETIHHNKDIMEFLNRTPQVDMQAHDKASAAVATDIMSTAAWREELARQQVMGNQEIVSAIEQKLHGLSQDLGAQRSPTSMISQASTPPTTALTPTPTPMNLSVQHPRQSLGAKLVEYVEQLFVLLKKTNEDPSIQKERVKNLLNDKRAYSMLFVHQMQSGKTLFVSLMEHDSGITFKAWVEQSGLKRTFHALLKQAADCTHTPLQIIKSILQLEWGAFHHSILQRLVTDESLKHAFFHELVRTGSWDWITKQWDYFKPFLTSEALNGWGEIWEKYGFNALYWLTNNSEGCQLLKSKWHDIKRVLTPEGLNRSLDTPNNKGRSSLYQLVSRAAGRHFLIEKWSEIKGFITPEGFNRAIEVGEEQGKSPLYLLVESVEGRQLLKKRWKDIYPLLSSEGLNRPLSMEKHRGKSPLYWLSHTLDGLELLTERWDEIMVLLTREGLNRPTETIVNEGWWKHFAPLSTVAKNSTVEPEVKKGESPLFWIAAWPEGRQLLRDKWDDFKLLISQEGLNSPVETGTETGKSAFYWLAGYPEGRQLIKEKWTDFKLLLTQSGLNRPVELGDEKGISPFYMFVVAAEGCDLFKEKWEDLYPLLTKEGLNRVVEVGEEKGKSPLFWFTASQAGRQILNKRWHDVYPLLTSTAFNRPVEADEDKGTTPLYFLFVRQEGYQLLKERWNEIKTLITAAGLNQPVETGIDKGVSPLLYLFGQPEGRQLLLEKWDDIHPLLTKEGLNRPCEMGEEKGRSPLYYLTAFEQGILLLRQKWSHFKPLLTKEGLNKRAETREGKGTSGLYYLVHSPAGRELLSQYWDDIKPLLSMEGLNRQIETGEDAGKSPLYILANTLKGRQLLKDKWNDIQPLLSFTEIKRAVGGVSVLDILNKDPETAALINHWSNTTPLLTHGLYSPVVTNSVTTKLVALM